MQNYFKKIIIVDRDDFMAVQAVLKWELEDNIKNFIYVCIGTGIASTIILNGEIVRGTHEHAGNLGHTTIIPDGKMCSCGKRGCLETVASGKAIAYKGLLIAKNKSVWDLLNKEKKSVSITAKLLAQMAKRGDVYAEEIWNEAAKYLGIAIANLYNVFDPQMILLGGGIPQAGSIFLNPLLKAIKSNVLPGLQKSINIQVSSLGMFAGALGAACSVFSEKGIQNNISN